METGGRFSNQKFSKGALVYEGKAKRLYQVEGHADLIWQEFKDSLTAFNAQKKGNFANKGALNREISSLLFQELEKNGVRTHRVADVSATEEVTKKLEMVKLELVVRNVLAGSTAKKFGIEEGTPLEKPLVEFYYKDDALADPFVSDDQAIMMKAAKSHGELDELKAFALKVNETLRAVMYYYNVRSLRHLLTLIRVDNQYYFIMSLKFLLGKTSQANNLTHRWSGKG